MLMIYTVIFPIIDQFAVFVLMISICVESQDTISCPVDISYWYISRKQDVPGGASTVRNLTILNQAHTRELPVDTKKGWRRLNLRPRGVLLTIVVL